MGKLKLTTVQPCTPEAKKLFDSILSGEEFKTLDVQLAEFRLKQNVLGRREIRIKGARRFVIVYIYVSAKLDQIHVLSYHLERKGEPSEKQLAKVDEYVKAIQSLEGE